jgi:hypothetical protein
VTHLFASSGFHLTGTQVGIAGAGVAFFTALASLIVGQKNETRRARQALHIEELRIAASREVEERRIAAAAEADTRRWVRDELKAGLAFVFAGVDDLLEEWERAAIARDRWLAESSRDGSSSADSSVTVEFERAAVAAWERGNHDWERLDATLTGVALVGSPALVEAAMDLHKSFDSLRHHLRPPSPTSDNVATYRNDATLVSTARWRLVEVARTEFGLKDLAPDPEAE